MSPHPLTPYLEQLSTRLLHTRIVLELCDSEDPAVQLAYKQVLHMHDLVEQCFEALRRNTP